MAPHTPQRSRRPGGAVPPLDLPKKTLDYYRAVPYVLIVESVQRGGAWVRRAAYPELPNCSVEAPSAVEAMERLETKRLRVLTEMWDRGELIPEPRPALRV